MKSVIALTLALAATVSADAVTVGFSNGAQKNYKTCSFSTDDASHSVGVMCGSNNLLATSAQLTNVPAGINCTITNRADVIGTLTEENTYADFPGSEPINLSSGGRIRCSI